MSAPSIEDCGLYKVMYHVYIDGKAWDYFTEQLADAEDMYTAECANIDGAEVVHLHEERYWTKEQYDNDHADENCIRTSEDEAEILENYNEAIRRAS